MFSTSDTIVAIATPAGRGGLGVIRLSGPDAASLASALIGRTVPLKPRYATFAKLVTGGRRQSTPDQVVLTYFVAPSSYTGEDVVEIAAHGSPVVLNSILRSAIEAGARLAEPGEFTLRAFLNQKPDLIQAEAVADLIDAVTPMQARTAFDQLEGTLTTAIAAIDTDLIDITAKLEASLDFPDEGYHFVAPKEARESIGALVAKIDALLLQASRGRLIRDGAQVAIVGSPNVGKSSLFNALLNAKRAIVTPIPGTTRDLLTERADIGGWSLSLIDTAGVRETSDIVEKEGVSRARETIGVADLTIVLLDRSRPLSNDDRELIGITASRPRVVVWNKIDLPPSQPLEPLGLELVAAAARQAGHQVMLIDLQVESHEEFVRLLHERRPEAVGFSCNYLANVPEIVDVAKLTKQQLPNSVVFVGGHSASFVAEALLEHADGAIDCVLKGEGEGAIGPLLAAIAEDRTALTHVPGTVTVRGQGPPAKMVASLDDFHPARHLLRHRRKYFIGVLDPCASIEFTRGCPWDCSFCSAWTFYGRSYRAASPEKIVVRSRNGASGWRIGVSSKPAPSAVGVHLSITIPLGT